MQFTKLSLEKFKSLYFKHFGEHLSDEEVRRKASNLIEVYRVVYGVPSVAELGESEQSDDE